MFDRVQVILVFLMNPRISLIKYCTSAQVKFTQDAIDETDTLEEVLKPRIDVIGGRLTKVVLNGTHLTPVAPVSLQLSYILSSQKSQQGFVKENRLYDVAIEP